MTVCASNQQLVDRSATLGLASMRMAHPRMGETTTVYTLAGENWLEATGRVEPSKDLISDSKFPVKCLHTCSTEPGTSGSPLLQRGKVVAMHLGTKGKNVAVAFVDHDKEWLATVPVRFRGTVVPGFNADFQQESKGKSYIPFDGVSEGLREKMDVVFRQLQDRFEEM
jgi:hypothetical protein